MSKVLVATTGSPFDTDAVHEALGLLGPDHELLFLFVQTNEVPAALTADGMGGAPAVPIPVEAWIEQGHHADEAARKKIQVVAERYPGAMVRVEGGDPGERICTIAADEHVDLVVVGSHDVGTLRRVLGGSVSDNVAHHAPCPVLLIRHHAAH
jgi:nucleotide-binding universal stress UspA family protein